MTALEPTEITAGRLHLRPWRPDDVDAVLAACQDPALQRWTTVPVPYRREDAERYVGPVAQEGWRSGSAAHLAVVDAVDAGLLAAVSLVGVDGPRPEVGAWAAAAARGRGVVPDAVQALARWAFGALGLPRLEWVAEVGNGASLRAAVKAGFALEGRQRGALARRDGSRADSWLLARLASDGPDGAAPAQPSPGVLEAGDLRLRPWRPDDAPALLAAFGDESPALPGPPRPMAPEEQVRRWTGEAAPELWAAGRAAPVAVLSAAGDVVGSLQLWRLRRGGIAEVGVWVAPAWRRRGTAATALEALLGWAVPALALRRVEWRTDPGNAASLALAARLGFVHEGVARAAVPGDPPGDDVVLARTWV